MKNQISRRQFLGGTAAAFAFTFVPKSVLGTDGNTPPSRKLNIAAVGAAGMARVDIDACSTENIVAICDVDESNAAQTYQAYPQAKKYKDFRQMLEKEKNIEAVIVATPDHTHAVAAMMAIKMGKHVYVQKPLTRTIYESRMLTEAARKYNIVSQMGNQGHSGEGVRLMCEWIWDGAIGPVRQVHAWTNRPVWPVAKSRPKETPDVPATLDWDLWLGPAAYRPYHPCYHPGSWRAWYDFGCGALGDMGSHVLDPVFTALKLGYPESIEARVSEESEQWFKRAVNTEGFPQSSIIWFHFPARGEMPPVKVTWYDGGLMPERPEELEEGRMMGDENGGVIFVGDKGKLMCGCYGLGPQLIPAKAMKEYKRPPKTLARIPNGMDGHEQNWIQACKNGTAASSHFDYSGPFTENILMGNIAIRLPGKKLLWDGPNLNFKNSPEANAMIKSEYRQGWTL
jgi:predicted dehydrogenase